MIINNDSLFALKELDDNSIDFVCTDPPYGYSFMGKDWDKAVPSVEIWRECLRVLKPGAFCCVMSAPRSDVQNTMISRLMEAGFRLDFTPIYWTYASGFPKAGNVGKLVDKRRDWQKARELASKIKERRLELGLTKEQAFRLCSFKAQSFGGNSWYEDGRIPSKEDYRLIKAGLGLDDSFDIAFEEVERELLAKEKNWGQAGSTPLTGYKEYEVTKGSSHLEGSYTGFQPKPAVEVIIVAMKPLSEKTYVDQALANGKGITWLDDCRVPTDSDTARKPSPTIGTNSYGKSELMGGIGHANGRFPANLLVSDDVLNDGVVTKSGKSKANTYEKHGGQWGQGKQIRGADFGDSGSYSRYFDLDKWAAAHLPEQQMQTFPFAIFPKASKGEKNKGLEHLQAGEHNTVVPNNPSCAVCGGNKYDRKNGMAVCHCSEPEWNKSKDIPNKNHHPTVKPLKLMSYLITLFSREGDTILDPFVGSGTTVVAAKQLNRKGIGIEREAEYAEIASARIDAVEKDKQLELV